MKRIYQRTGATVGQNGDCFAACVASLLELRLDDVPNFYGESRNGAPLPPKALADMTAWFRQRGMVYVEFGFVQSVLPTLAMMYQINPGLTHFLIGCTNHHSTHAVLARDGTIVHDPAMAPGKGSVLTRPCRDGLTRIGFIALAL